MTSLSTPHKVGHISGFVLALANLTTAAVPGPPLPVVIFGAVVGLTCLALLTVSWVRGSTGARRVAAVLLALAALSAIPAFFVPEVSSGTQLVAGFGILWTVATIVLLFYPDRQSALAGAR